MSFVQAYYHIVINTHNRSVNLSLDYSDDLYKYICGIARNKGCTILAINGTRNHIHFILELHPSVALAEIMMLIKRQSNLWMKSDLRFAKFGSWGKEYFATTIAPRDIDAVARYVHNQREHHKEVPFELEIRRIVENCGGTWQPYLLT